MKIITLNGSPQGKNGNTLATFRLIQEGMGDVEVIDYQISQKINSIEKKEEKLLEIFNAIESADLIVWVFPAYVFFLPCGLKRFVEI